MANDLCSAYYVNLVEEVENGGDMHPLFFTNKDCSGPTFPRQELSGGINWATSLTFTKKDVCDGSSLTNCVPGFQKAFVPDGMEVIFHADTDYELVAEPGTYILNADIGTGGISNNIWTVGSTLTDGGNFANPSTFGKHTMFEDRWYNPLALKTTCISAPPNAGHVVKDGHYMYNTYNAVPALTPGPGCCSAGDIYNNAGFLCTTCGGDAFYGGNKVKTSIFSCGSIFWPTFTGAMASTSQFLQNGNDWQIVPVTPRPPGHLYTWSSTASPGSPAVEKIRVHNTEFCVGNTNLFVDNVYPISDAFNDGASKGSGDYPVTGGAFAYIKGIGKITYSAFDCLMPNNQTYDNAGACQQPRGTISGPNNSNSCTEPFTVRASGSVGSFEVRPITSMVDKIINACTGVTPMQVGGFTIDRYKNGSPDCEDYFNQICTNTAIIKTNKVYRKACACILEKKHLEFQYRSINLPVACFSDVCNNPEPGVYKTKGMMSGCNTKLCQQIVNIHGSGIAHEGHQTLLCDNHVYNISTNDLPQPDLPKLPSNINPKDATNITFSTVFYFALAFTGLIFMVIIVWLIRKAVLKRQKSTFVNKRNTQNVSSMIRRF